jgi:pyruvate-formate lyase-activating enzyme
MNVDKGFNLYVDISTACNAKCPFCIAETKDRKDSINFMDGARFAIELTAKLGGSVQVVGGEPMVTRKIFPLLSALRPYRFHRIVVNTNGSFITKEKAQAMKDAHVTHVNISHHHYDEKINDEIMRIKPFLPDSSIRDAVDLLEEDFELRINCNLIQGYIYNIDKIMAFVYWANGVGVREVSFSQLFPLSLFNYQVPPEKWYTETHQVDLEGIVDDLDSLFRPVTPDTVASVWGKSTWSGAHRRFWRLPQGNTVSVKTLGGFDKNGKPLPSTYDQKQDPELQDTLCFAVVHPDGRVTASWDRRERILFDPAGYNNVPTGALELSFAK